ncbi:MAG: hypothetical protein BroJett011_51890 [Chloroflexota bacterium]|nr:MAG: hypothetical protein BroJett011_51890 [Chloroflexota bacterium]
MNRTFFQASLFKLIRALALAVIGLDWCAGAMVLAADPAVNVVAPSNEFGEAGAALGNVWDMNSLNDVAWTQPDAKNRKVQYTLWPATAPGVPPGGSGFVLRGVTPKGSDLASAFYTNSQVSIPSHIYRYLIYRLYLAPHQPDEAGIQLTNARLLYTSQWGSNWQVEAFPFRRYSRPQRLECPPFGTAYGGWCTFFIDLAQPTVNGPGSPNPWDWGQPGARVEAFGFWPHENWCDSTCAPSGDSPNYFYLDYVYLTGNIVAKYPDYNYEIRWNVSDPDGGQLTSNLYYQRRDEILTPAESPGCNVANLATHWTLIGSTSITVGGMPSQNKVYLPLIGKSKPNSRFGSGDGGPFNQSFIWNLSSSAYATGKVYYICVVVQDGNGNQNYGVSSAPVIKAPRPTVLNPNNFQAGSPR